MSSKGLFGTSGIRGDAKKFFTEQFCFDIGKSFVEFLKRHDQLGPIAVGMDPRASSPRIKEGLFKGLATGGVELFDEEISPIPSMNWLLKSTQVKGAVMVTGSHIAPELNGVKFYAHDEEVSVKDQNEIESIYKGVKNKDKAPDTVPNVVKENRANELYSEMLYKQVLKPLPKWRVALDCANGAQSIVIPELLARLGLDVVEVNCDIQKDFIARDTDTDDKAEIGLLKKSVKENDCDFGVAFDGDGDRSVFIDEKGEFVLGEYSCSLIVRESDSDPIVTTISSSQVVDSLGKKVIRTKVGSPYVVGEMKRVGATFGFEQNGGAISSEVMFTRDGGTVLMKMFNIFSRFKGSFSEMVATLPKFYMARTKVDYKWELKDTIISEAKREFKGIKTEEVDGLKIWLSKDTWILFRSSQNAPEFRVFAESKSKGKSQKLLAKGIKLVKDIIDSHS